MVLIYFDGGSMYYRLVCTHCNLQMNDLASFRCRRCGSVLEIDYDYGGLSLPRNFRRERIANSKYSPFLPVESLSAGLGEGGTPLVAKRLEWVERADVLFKLETKNPTNSFKDRGSAVEITKAMEFGFGSVVCASTGNMGMSVARYAQKAGIKATIFISRGGNPKKIMKIRKYGAKVIEVKKDFNEALRDAEKFASSEGIFLCGDYHYRKEGQKTVIYEIIEQLKYRVPDFIFAPVGNATLISAIYKGLREFRDFLFIEKLPKLVAVQSSGCDPLVKAYNRGEKIGYVKPSTIADAIAVGYPTFGLEGVDALRSTKGRAVRVSDKEIIKSMKELESIGIYTETGGAAAFAGFRSLYSDYKKSFRGKTVAVLATGNNER